MNRLLYTIIGYILALMLVASCGGGGGGGGGGNPAPDPDNPRPTDSGNPAYPGFGFTLSAGDYWEFYWTYRHTTFSSGSSGVDTDAGRIRLTLGQATNIEGITAFRMLASGDLYDIDGNTYAPRWRYLAIDDHRLLGSLDGSTLEVIFDAMNGRWTGGGFGTVFGNSTAITASEGAIDNEFTNTSALVVQRSASQNFCETIAGYTVCSNDSAYDLNEREYFKAGIGPIGYYLRFGWAGGSGSLYTTFTYERHIGLVASSLSAEDGWLPTSPPWTLKTDMPTARTGHTAASVNGLIYVIGGTNMSSDLNTVEIYDPTTDSWTTGRNLPQARSRHASAVVNGRIYIMGGFVGTGVSNTVLEYTPARDQWVYKASMPVALRNHVAAETDGRIVVFADNSRNAYLYDPARDTWYYITNIPNPEYGRTAVGHNGRYYLFGGWSENTDRAYVRELTVGALGEPDTWRYVASMPTARRSAGAAVINNLIYVVGGFNGTDQYLRTLEKYNPVSNTWYSAYPMLRSRQNPAVAVANNNRLYVIGGYNGDTVSNAVEEYNPAAD